MTRENELLRKIADGEPSAWEELAALYYDEILRYCIYHTPDYQTAEDAVQETFLKVMRFFPRYRNRGKFRAFLYQVAANTCKDLWRRRRESFLEDEVGAEGSADDCAVYVESGFAGAEAEMNFRRLVDRLPEEQREAVYLRFAQELTLREAAAVMGLPLRTVQSRLRAAMKALRRAEKSEGKEGVEDG